MACRESLKTLRAMPDLRCEVLILAHNEAANIEESVRSVLTQSWASETSLVGIIVVSTDSTDGTDDIVRELQRVDKRVRLLALPDRRGKVFDVNTGIRHTTERLLAIIDADVTVSEDCIPRLLEPMRSGNIGLTTPARAALNMRHGVMNRIGHFMAELHNTLDRAKCGQVIVVDRRFAVIDERVTVDDAFQEWAVIQAGSTVERVPEAVVWSMAATTANDLIRQRRRVHAQYLNLERVTGYRPATRSFKSVARAAIRTPTVLKDRRLDIVAIAMLLDSWARLLGRLDGIAGRKYETWVASPTTKSHA